jgi:hypothetical protein
MITYLLIKYGNEKAYDLEDFICILIATPLAIIVDLLFVLFQPIFYLIYEKWQKEREL